MNRAHSVIAGACSWLAGHTGALIIGLAVVWMAATPSPVWGQWNGTNPVWTNSNVGIGTTVPAAKLHVSGDVQIDQVSGAAELYVGSNKATSSGRIEWDNNNVRLNIGINAVNYLSLYNGNVGIGTTNPQYLLSVKGTIGAKDVIVTNTGWSDYVFQPGYRLRPLSEVGAYIQANHHLPDIPSEAEVKEKGVSVGDMQSKLLAKVEELTLHMIQADERNNHLEQQNRELHDRIGRLEKGAATSATPTAAK